MNNLEIHCAVCGRTTLARKEAVYEGFKKTGELFICTGCGTRFDSAAETPFVQQEIRPSVFSADDKPLPPAIFSDDERQRSCGWCRQFVVNPFSQRCGLTNKETQATDLCAQFERKAGEVS